MPNQDNYRSDVTNTTQSRFLASRIVKLPGEPILFEEVPASFGYDAEDNIEIHFYTKRANTLITSFTTKLSDGVVKLHIVSYDDGTYKTYLQIDFTKLFEINARAIVPGDYKVTINFFSDEIGSYDDRILTISEISPSKTELEVIFNNSIDEVTTQNNAKLASEFIYPSFTKAEAIGVMKKVIKDGVELNDDAEGMTGNNITENMTISGIQTIESTMGRLQTMELDQHFKDALNEYLPKLFEKIREEIVIGDERVQSYELETFLRSELQRTLEQLQVSLDTRIKIR